MRLGVLSQTKLITGEELYDTAYALGLTSYTREELIPRVDGVNQLWRLLECWKWKDCLVACVWVFEYWTHIRFMGLTCFECLERRHGISLDPIHISKIAKILDVLPIVIPVIQTEKLVFVPWFWAKDLPNVTCKRTWIRWWTPWPISSIWSGSAPWNIPWKLMLGRWISLKFPMVPFLRTSWFFGGVAKP